MGGAGILIVGRHGNTELSLPTGIVASSFEPEAYAARAAFEHILRLPMDIGRTVRWFTDSKSCIEQLQSIWDTYREAIGHGRIPYRTS